MKKLLFVFFASIILLLAFVYFVSKNALPNWLGFYEIKRLEEKIILSSQSVDGQKAAYMQILLEKRLEELKRITDNRNYDIYYKTSLRYGTQAGELADLIISKKLQNERKTTLALFKKHQQDIKKLLENKDNRDEWKFIQDDINYLTAYSAKLSQ